MFLKLQLARLSSTYPTHMYFLVMPLDLLLATSAHSGILATIDSSPTVFLVLEVLQTLEQGNQPKTYHTTAE